MANPTFFDLFKITWGQNGLTDSITDLQYKTGWAFIGSVPPSVEQFNKVQQSTDERLAWIYQQLEGLAAITGRPLAATSFDALSYAFQNLNASNLKSGIVPVARLSGTATALTAGAAQKLATPRSIGLTGDVRGMGEFDGSKDLSFATTLADTTVIAGSYGNANTIPQFTVDPKGRLTAAGALPVGLAGSATKLATGRLFSISGGATAASVNFDGTANVALNVTALDVSKANAGILPVARGGTGLATVPAASYLSGSGGAPMVPRTPAEVLEDIAALPRAGGRLSGPLVLERAGCMGVEYGPSFTGPLVLLPNGGGYAGTAASVTGAMRVTLPAAASGVNTMLRLRVDVFEYLADVPPVSILIHGYAQSNKTWARCGATVLAGNVASDLPIRFGADGAGNLCFWIGDVGKTWSYPSVIISEVHAKHTNRSATVADWGAGWKVDAVTVMESVSQTLASGNLAVGRAEISGIGGLQAALDQKANASVNMVAGAGLTGGGTLAASRTFAMGTPSTLSGASTNSSSGTTHSHALAAANQSAAGIARFATLAEGQAGGSQDLIMSPYVVGQVVRSLTPAPPALTDIRLGAQVQVNAGGQVVPAGCVSTGAHTLDDNRINRQWYRPLQKLWNGSWVTVAVES